ncbi:MAG: hypothetical protein MUF54_26090, partial [Polyangiaceae bacterium]|nr:hypothetical protein [Polyangiaceae bacterium]
PWTRRAFAGCDVIIVAAGPRLRGGEKRDEKAADAAMLLSGEPGKSIVEALTNHTAAERERSTPHDESSILLVVTNPVEGIVTWLAERTGWDRRRIVGLGTAVESARFSRMLADRLNVDAGSVWTELIGEHGEQIELRDAEATRRRVRELGREVNLEQLLGRTRSAASEIRHYAEAAGRAQAQRLLDRVGFDGPARARLEPELAAALCPPATRFAIAASAVEVVEAIASDRGRVLPVSGFAGIGGLPDVALAVPFVVARAGVVRVGKMQPTDVLRAAAASVQAQVEAMRRVGHPAAEPR